VCVCCVSARALVSHPPPCLATPTEHNITLCVCAIQARHMIFVQTVAILFLHLVLHSTCQRTLPTLPPHYLTLDLIVIRGEWRGHMQICSEQSEEAQQEYMRCCFFFVQIYLKLAVARGHIFLPPTQLPRSLIPWCQQRPECHKIWLFHLFPLGTRLFQTAS